MSDPFSNGIDIAFALVALLVIAWLTLDTRKFFEIVFRSVKPPGGRTIAAVRVIAAGCAIGIAVFLVLHFAACYQVSK